VTAWARCEPQNGSSGSPAVVIDSDKFMTSTMRRIMKSMKREGGSAPPAPQDLEINPAHAIMDAA